METYAAVFYSDAERGFLLQPQPGRGHRGPTQSWWMA